MAPLSISSSAIQEKNQINNEGVWLLLVEIQYPSETAIRVVLNNENITWNSNTYYAMQFKLGGIKQSKDGDLPTVDLSILDIDRRVSPYLDDYDGGVGADVTISLVHSDHLNLATAEMEFDFKIVGCSINHMNLVTLNLGASNLFLYRIPQNRYLQDHCRYKDFKGTLCGYSGGETECVRTFARCKELSNEARFGGFPGIGFQGYYA